MRRCRPLIIVLLLGAALIVAPSALALAPATEDCLKHDGRLTRSFTVQQLQAALNSMPADLKEYNSCAAVIQSQIDAELGRHVKRPRSGPGGAGSSGTTVLLIVVVVIVLGGGGLAVVAARRRRR